MKTKKRSVCMEMMHNDAMRIYDETKDMMKEEELTYCRERAEATCREHPRLRELEAVRRQSE